MLPYVRCRCVSAAEAVAVAGARPVPGSSAVGRRRVCARSGAGRRADCQRHVCAGAKADSTGLVAVSVWVRGFCVCEIYKVQGAMAAMSRVTAGTTRNEQFAIAPARVPGECVFICAGKWSGVCGIK